MRAFISGCLNNSRTVLWSDDYETLSSKEIKERVYFACGDLIQISGGRKIKASVLCKRELNAALALLSCWCAGIVPVPMSDNYGSRHCDGIIDLTEPDLLITDEINYVRYNISVYDIVNKTSVNIKSVYTEDPALSEAAAIMCTSGTTGVPKGAIITESGLTGNASAISEYFSVKAGENILIARPLYHCAVLTGEFLLSLYKGLNIRFFNESYNPVSVLNKIGNCEIDIMCATPTLFTHLSAFIKRSGRGTALKTIALSGECTGTENARAIREAFPDTDIYNVYGLTEASPRVSWLSPDLYDLYPGSVGIPLRGVSIKITDVSDTGRELPRCEEGLVMIKTPYLMGGYYRNITQNEKILSDGWFNTGDIGFIDNNNLLYILSRADDMIIRAGMNIYPLEIENAVLQTGIITGAVVYRIREKSGESIGINVTVNQPVKQKDLIKIISEILPPYQMPSELNIVDKIDKNASGKTIRPNK